MKITIRDIIQNSGYEILSEMIMPCKKTSDGIFVFKLKFTKERVERMRARISSVGIFYDYDITGEFDVYVDEVGVDGLGLEAIIYVVLNTLETPESPSKLWDMAGYGDEY